MDSITFIAAISASENCGKWEKAVQPFKAVEECSVGSWTVTDVVQGSITESWIIVFCECFVGLGAMRRQL